MFRVLCMSESAHLCGADSSHGDNSFLSERLLLFDKRSRIVGVKYSKLLSWSTLQLPTVFMLNPFTEITLLGKFSLSRKFSEFMPRKFCHCACFYRPISKKKKKIKFFLISANLFISGLTNVHCHFLSGHGLHVTKHYVVRVKSQLSDFS